MTTDISPERFFSLSCIEGLRLFRIHRTSNPGLPVDQLLSLIDKVEADARHLDMEASVRLSTIVEDDCPLDGHAFYQSCIEAILLKHSPSWSKNMRQGRLRFLSNTTPNNRDVFAAAGLMKDPIPLDVIMWWDVISGVAHFISGQSMMERGRKAEIQTLKYERKKLKVARIAQEPKWPGLDDNYLGYDVLSYKRVPNGTISPQLIEVKSTIASPMRFFISRNEWDKALQSSDNYLFHIWNMTRTQSVPYIMTVNDVKPHIPMNKGKGSWHQAHIPVNTS